MPKVDEAYSRLAGVYDEIVVNPCYAEWAQFLHRRWSDDEQSVHSILDVCCGTGLLAAELIELGYDVVGLDASAEMLERARSLLGPAVPLHHQSLSDLEVPGVFDAVVSTYDGLNYLNSTDLVLSLQRLHEVLRPGGWLAFDLHTDAMMQFTLSNPVVSGHDQGWTFTISSEVDPDVRTCTTRIDATDDVGAESFSESHQQYFHSDDDVRSALAAAGFDLVAIVDEYTDEPVNDSTLRATWVARR